MKKIFTTFIGCLISYTCFSQTFILSRDTADATFINNAIQERIYVTNNSNTMLIKFELVSNTMPSNWLLSLCTHDVCMPSIPTIGTFAYFTNGQQGYFELTANSGGNVGDGFLSYRVYENGNPTNDDTLTFAYHQNAITGIVENATTKEHLSQNYPNPFVGSTTISYNLTASNGKLVVTELSGKIVEQHILRNKVGAISFGETLSAGTYIYALWSNNKLVAKNKMIAK